MKRIISYLLLAGIVVCPGFDIGEAAFDDVKGERIQTAVEFLQDESVVDGYPDGSFRPNQSVTRAEALKMLIESAGGMTSHRAGRTGFTDVSRRIWYAPYVEEAQELGITNGYADGSFRPEQSVTRAEALKMLLGINNIDVSFLTEFSLQDVRPGDWYAPYVLTGWEKGLADINNGFFRPQIEMTRGELADMIFRMMVLSRTGQERFSDSLIAQVIPIEVDAPNSQMTVPQEIIIPTGDDLVVGTGAVVIIEDEMVDEDPVDEFSGILTISLSNDTPGSEQVMHGEQKKELLRFVAYPQYADNYLEEVDIEIEGDPDQIDKLFIYRGDEMIGEGMFLSIVNGVASTRWQWRGDKRPVIRKDENVVFSIRADLAIGQGAEIASGSAGSFRVKIANVEGASGGLGVKYSPGLSALVSDFFLPYDALPEVVIDGDSIYGQRGAPSRGMTVLAFKVMVKSNSSDIRRQAVQIDRLNLQVAGSAGAAGFQLVREKDGLRVASGEGCHPIDKMTPTNIVFDMAGMSSERREIVEGNDEIFLVKADVEAIIDDGRSAFLSQAINLGKLSSDGQEVAGDFEWSAISNSSVTGSSKVVQQVPNLLVPEPLIFDTSGGGGVGCH